VVTNRIKSIVLAALALSVLLVQPVCLTHETDIDDHAACSASIADAALVDLAAAGLPVAKPSPAVPFAEILPPPWRMAARNTAAATPPDHPPSSPPYHARSARVLS
jgi:hypothetical protein